MKKNLLRKKLVMVFGVFDGLYAGHQAFLKAAKKEGKELIVVVARDSFVRSFKKKTPDWDEGKRLREMQKVAIVSKAILGDEVIGSYEVIKKYKPDIICVGYDQDALEDDLSRSMNASTIPRIPIMRMARYTMRQ